MEQETKVTEEGTTFRGLGRAYQLHDGVHVSLSMQSKPREKGLYTTHTKLHILWPQQDSDIIGAFEFKYILHGHIGQVVPVDVMKP